MKEHRELAQLKLLSAPELGRDFTMVWDDCFVTPADMRRKSRHGAPSRVGDAVVGHIAPALAAHLRRGLGAGHSVTFCFVHFHMNTWVGGSDQHMNEVCLFTTLDMSSLLASPPSKVYGGLGGESCTSL